MKNKKYTLHDRFTFGKYRGRTVQDILTQDASYIDWCIENVPGFSLDCNKSTRDADIYANDIEVLKRNPWTNRIMTYAKRFAEDVCWMPIPISTKHAQYQQLEIPFV